MKKIIFCIAVILLQAMLIFAQDCNPELKIFKARHSDAKSLYEIVSGLVSKDGKVSFDTNTNSLIVVDCPQNLERIATLINTLDVSEKQVQIKVLVVETTNRALEDIGITHSGVIIPEAKFFAIVDLLKKDKNTNIRSEMMVRTLSNQPAMLQVTREEIIGTGSVITADGTIITSPIREPIGSMLEVLPRVNNDGTINIILRPSVSTIQKNRTPSERTILTQVLIKSGDTVAIGGADTQKETERESQTLFGVPLSKKSVSENKKVEMFLTAKITD